MSGPPLSRGQALDDRRFASRPRPPNSLRWVVLRQFLQTRPDRARRHASSHRHCGNATITRSKRLRRRHQTTAPFVEIGRYRGKPLSDRFNIDHHHNIWYDYTVVNPYLTLSKVNSTFSGQLLSNELRSISGQSRWPSTPTSSFPTIAIRIAASPTSGERGMHRPRPFWSAIQGRNHPQHTFKIRDKSLQGRSSWSGSPQHHLGHDAP